LPQPLPPTRRTNTTSSHPSRDPDQRLRSRATSVWD
jgi:hypothetical protein